jgi:hypothetical protein
MPRSLVDDLRGRLAAAEKHRAELGAARQRLLLRGVKLAIAKVQHNINCTSGLSPLILRQIHFREV